MALRGTLKDFGIADIFQLIGHQAKNGVLSISNKDQAVKIYFHNGNVVKAEPATRKKREMLGRMLVRAEVIKESQLTQALDVQKKTLKRIGDILIELKAIDRATLKKFAKLQTMETIYRLFLWDSGHYEFSQAEIELEADAETIRGENILMEGFRQVDEWPKIREKITSYRMTFEKLEDLDALMREAEACTSSSDSSDSSDTDEDDLGLDDAFGEFDESSANKHKDPRLKDIGTNEQTVFQYIEKKRDVQKLIDLSQLGEFETGKALVNLINAELIGSLGTVKGKPSADALVGGIHAPKYRGRWLTAAGQAFIAILLIAGILYIAWQLGISKNVWLSNSSASTQVIAQDLQIALSRSALAKIKSALELYRLETGSYPNKIEKLVNVGILQEKDLYFPWKQRYFYKQKEEHYLLLRPVY